MTLWQGSPVTYVRDDYGVWKFDGVHEVPAPKGDKIRSGVLRELGGEAQLVELLSLVSIRRIMQGDPAFFNLAAGWVNREGWMS